LTKVIFYYIIIIDNNNIRVLMMKNSKADLLLHPVRFRIVQTVVGGHHFTTQQIMELLPDIPQATLYRQLNKLLEGGILEVVEERQVRGTKEKVFAMVENGASLSAKDLSSSNKEDHMQYFLAFLSTIQSSFDRYLQQEELDLEADGVGYRQVPLFLSDEEFTVFTQKMASIILEAAKNAPTDERRRRTLSTIIIPDPK
jgi:hypothetical protein